MLNFRSPFEELIRNKGGFITCSYIIPFLMGSQMARLLQGKYLKDYVMCGAELSCQIVYFGLLFFSSFLFIDLIIKIAGDTLGVSEDKTFGKFSIFAPILAPLSFGGELLIRTNYFLNELPDFLPTFGRQFGFNFDRFVFNIPLIFEKFILYFIILSSALASIYVLYKFINDDFSGLISKYRAYIAYSFVIIVSLIYLYLMPV